MSKADEASPVQGDVRRPEGTTLNAQKKCNVWLRYCLEIGWQKDQLDDLENIWWKFRDKNGNFITPNAAVHRRGPE